MPVGKYKKSGYLKYRDPTEVEEFKIEERKVKEPKKLKNTKLTKEAALKLRKRAAAKRLAPGLHKIQMFYDAVIVHTWEALRRFPLPADWDDPLGIAAIGFLRIWVPAIGAEQAADNVQECGEAAYG